MRPLSRFHGLRVGGERNMLRILLESSDLTLDHTEAKKGRGLPKITKLESQQHYLIQVYILQEWR